MQPKLSPLVTFTVPADSTMETLAPNVPVSPHCRQRLTEALAGTVPLGQELCGGFLKMPGDFTKQEALDEVAALGSKFRLGTWKEAFAYRASNQTPSAFVVFGLDLAWEYIVAYFGQFVGPRRKPAHQAAPAKWCPAYEIFVVRE